MFVLVQSESIVACALITSYSILTDMLTSTVIHSTFILVCERREKYNYMRSCIGYFPGVSFCSAHGIKLFYFDGYYYILLDYDSMIFGAW